MIFIHALLYTIDVTNIPVILMAFEFSDIREPTKTYTYGVSNCLCKARSNGIEFFPSKLFAISSQMKHSIKPRKMKNEIQ